MVKLLPRSCRRWFPFYSDVTPCISRNWSLTNRPAYVPIDLQHSRALKKHNNICADTSNISCGRGLPLSKLMSHALEMCFRRYMVYIVCVEAYDLPGGEAAIIISDPFISVLTFNISNSYSLKLRSKSDQSAIGPIHRTTLRLGKCP